MEGFNQREYQTVILAALLHDIGKMLHRRSGIKSNHFEASAAFVSEHLKDENLYNTCLLRFLVKYHHGTKTDALKDPALEAAGCNMRERWWMLLKIIKAADSFSCAERDQEQPFLGFRDRTCDLDSIFSLVNLSGAPEEETRKYKVPFVPLDPQSAFPTPDEPSGSLDTLIDSFLTEVPTLPTLNIFDNLVNKWTELLERYTWCVPGDTRYEISDVSLFDHLRSSAAIAACLYRKRTEVGGPNGGNELILVGGDYSGIQDYIFGIIGGAGGGVSKRLRARSFFVSAFCEATVHKILHAFGLPLVCNVFSSGGKFLLLVPDAEGADKVLEKVRREIESEIHGNYFSCFSFLMCWRKIGDYRSAMKVYSFFKLADDIFHDLETGKRRKSYEVLRTETGDWDEAAFRADTLYRSYGGGGDCKGCGKGPGTNEEKDEKGGVLELCDICHRDKNVIGRLLPKAKFVGFGRGIVSDSKKEIPLFGGETGYFIKIMTECEDFSPFYLVWALDNANCSSSVRKYLANYVPTDCDGDIVTFEDLAKRSIRIVAGKEKGSELLGVLKADVDNLGLIFSKGFENPSRFEQGVADADRKTMSRFLTMSRMLDLFFSGWMREILVGNHKTAVIEELSSLPGIDVERFAKYISELQIDLGSIYTVYSGGDDLVLVGPWETMVIFAVFLDRKFREFTCTTSDITLSAGLAIVKPQHPISSSACHADALLELSKKGGKDRVTLFGTTTKWENFSPLVDFFARVDERMVDASSAIKTTFLHRLLEYQRMALEFLDKDRVEGLRCMSLLSYDLGRNFFDREQNRLTEDGSIFRPLLDGKPSKASLMANLKIPISWSLLRNR